MATATPYAGVTAGVGVEIEVSVPGSRGGGPAGSRLKTRLHPQEILFDIWQPTPGRPVTAKLHGSDDDLVDQPLVLVVVAGAVRALLGGLLLAIPYSTVLEQTRNRIYASRSRAFFCMLCRPWGSAGWLAYQYVPHAAPRPV